MTEKHNSRSAKFLGGVNRVGCSRGVSLWGWRGTASQIDGGAAFCLWYPTSYVYCWGAKFRARGGGAFAWDGRCCGSRITTVTAGSGRELLASPPGQGRRVFLRMCGGRSKGVHKNGVNPVQGCRRFARRVWLRLNTVGEIRPLPARRPPAERRWPGKNRTPRADRKGRRD